MRLSSSNRSGMRGFTLMELMLTVMLAALILGFGVPSFRNMMASNRITTQTNDFVGAVNFARSEAITRNTNITFCRANAVTDTVCSASNDPWPAWIVLAPGGNVIRNGEINNFGGTLLVSSDLVNETVTFNASGLASTGGAPVTDDTISVCTTHDIGTNFRVITLGAGSRISTVKDSGTCS